MNENVSVPQPHSPDPALKRLEVLVGTWMLTGRTLTSKEDNITGKVTIEWLPGGFFLQQRGEIEMLGQKFQSLEIVGYDPISQTFPSTVYSSMNGTPASYEWDIQGDLVMHWTEGSKYTGQLSPDGNTLTGGWRPEFGVAENSGNTYDATMSRVQATP